MCCHINFISLHTRFLFFRFYFRGYDREVLLISDASLLLLDIFGFRGGLVGQGSGKERGGTPLIFREGGTLGSDGCIGVRSEIYVSWGSVNGLCD